MNFLFPLYLLGAAAVMIPIILHLRRRPPKDRTEFSSLMLLQASPLERKRRRKLDNLWLLLARCALILLLAFLFSRPFFSGEILEAGAGSGKWVVLLVDRSASMQREKLWEEAVEKAKGQVRGAKPADRYALVLFDRHEQVAVGFKEWNETPPSERAALWERALAQAKPGWGETRLARAIAFAAELLDEEEQSQSGEASVFPEDATVVLISDLQEGSDLTELDTLAWPEGVRLALVPVEARSAENASLHLLASENVLSLVEEEEAGGEAGAATSEPGASGLRVRVFNERAAGREEFTVGWEGGAEATDVLVSAGMQRTLRFEWEIAKAGAEKRNPVLVLGGDEHAFDNRVYITGETRRPLRTLYFGGDDKTANDTTEPLFYLARAIQATNLHDPFVSNEIPGDVNLAETADFVVIADGAGKSGPAGIRDYLESGGTALFLLRNAGQGEMLGELLGAGTLVVEDAALDSEYALLDEIDFESPLLAAFADPRVRDFSKIHFWKYRRLAGGAAWPEGGEIVARFEGGDPAWLSYRIGAGTLIVFTSSWHPADSQLALSTKFVPLLYSILEQRGENQRAAQFAVGDPLPAGEGAVVTRPDGKEETVPAGAAFFRGTDLPGIYVATRGVEKLSFAVNLDASESRTLPLSADRFAEAGLPVENSADESATAPVAAGDQEREKHLLDVDKENRQQVWRWLVLGAIGVVFIEMILAGRRGAGSGVAGRDGPGDGTQPSTPGAVSSKGAS